MKTKTNHFSQEKLWNKVHKTSTKWKICSEDPNRVKQTVTRYPVNKAEVMKSVLHIICIISNMIILHFHGNPGLEITIFLFLNYLMLNSAACIQWSTIKLAITTQCPFILPALVFNEDRTCHHSPTRQRTSLFAHVAEMGKVKLAQHGNERKASRQNRRRK